MWISKIASGFKTNSTQLLWLIMLISLIDIVKAICKKDRLELKQSKKFQWIFLGIPGDSEAICTKKIGHGI